jgi:hypothetical protein
MGRRQQEQQPEQPYQENDNIEGEDDADFASDVAAALQDSGSRAPRAEPEDEPEEEAPDDEEPEDDAPPAPPPKAAAKQAQPEPYAKLKNAATIDELELELGDELVELLHRRLGNASSSGAFQRARDERRKNRADREAIDKDIAAFQAQVAEHDKLIAGIQAQHGALSEAMALARSGQPGPLHFLLAERGVNVAELAKSSAIAPAKRYTIAEEAPKPKREAPELPPEEGTEGLQKAPIELAKKMLDSLQKHDIAKLRPEKAIELLALELPKHQDPLTGHWAMRRSEIATIVVDRYMKELDEEREAIRPRPRRGKEEEPAPRRRAARQELPEDDEPEIDLPGRRRRVLTEEEQFKLDVGAAMRQSGGRL